MTWAAMRGNGRAVSYSLWSGWSHAVAEVGLIICRERWDSVRLGPVRVVSGWKKNEHFLTWCKRDEGVKTRQLMLEGRVFFRYG